MLTAVDQEEKIKVFSHFNANTRNEFKYFQFTNTFADTAFSLLYAWGEMFDYRYHAYDDSVMAVTGIGKGSSRGFALIRRTPDISINAAFQDICAYCFNCGIQPVFEYISKNELPDYIRAANSIGKNVEYFYQNMYSDYIYRTDEFISMSGNRNKTKRGGYNYLEKHYPEIRYEKYQPHMYHDILSIFDSWCSKHECRNCYYGCERRALERFMEIYDRKYHRIGLTYNGMKPLSFAVCEQINEETVSYYFQKNAERIRGLTYWLNRQMALEHEHIRYINLGEDMGIEGLITDKKLLHPCGMMKKYTVLII